MTVTDAQVRAMSEEYERSGNLSRAALKSAMDRKTARKYRDAGKIPSELKKERRWRTREDPFEEDWPRVRAMLEEAPELEAKTLFEFLLREEPGRYEPGQLRTLQRRVRAWRATSGPPKEVFFPQEHRLGEAMQTDFTCMTELEVTIAGEAFEHMLCHSVLPYSNWEWGTICFSESIPAIRAGVQNALFRLGRVPEKHQTDNSSAATHRVDDNKRSFNDNYQALMDHFGMKPRTTGVGKKEQNGDIEAANGALKARVAQHLLLRGSRDFDSVEDYERFLHGVMEAANNLRRKRLDEELACMRKLSVKRLPDHTEVRVRVTKWSTIRVKNNTYSVPSRLIDERVRVRVYDGRIEVYFRDQRQLVTDRLHGRHHHRIDYRHVIWSLVKKPHAFPRYRYREDLFPTLAFRRAYDALVDGVRTERAADLSYLRILHLAASTLECEVEAAIECLLEADQEPTYEAVKDLVKPTVQPSVPDMPAYDPDLGVYDRLLLGVSR